MVHCNRCNKDIEPDYKERPDTPHAGELRCPDCGFFLGWKAKPENEKKLSKRPNGAPTPADLNIDFCQLCLRQREWLGTNETLETHHINDDPTNHERLNLLVACTACHKLIAWLRLYTNTHLQGFYEHLV
jgi:DNA-directed RNA polymerase subunit RPC12/RpoP